MGFNECVLECIKQESLSPDSDCDGLKVFG